MAGSPEVPVSSPSGGTTEVPASVVDAPADAPTYNTTGAGANPAANSAPVRLSTKLANKSFPGVISAVAASEYRETANDTSQVGRVKVLLAIMKSLQDGTFEKQFQSGKLDAAVVNNLIDKVPSNQAQAQLSGLYDIGLSKSSVNALRQVVASETQQAYAAVGVQTNGTNYTSLANAGGDRLQELEKQETVARGAIAPLSPLTRTTSLMTLLDDLETGKSTSNVNPAVYSAMLSRAGVAQGMASTGSVGNVLSGLGPGGQLPPQLSKAVQRVTTQAIQTHMLNLAGNAADSEFVQDVKAANTAKALKAVSLPSHLTAMAGSDGYNMEHVTTFGSFFQQLQEQSVKTKQGLGIPGAIETTPAKAAANGTGQQFFDAFKEQWQKNPGYRAEVAAALTSAGVDPNAIGSSAADYSQAANALIKVMQQTPAGENPWAYLKAQPQVSATVLHSNPGYAIALAEATKIGAKLTNDQLNRLAQLYGGSATTGNTDALDQAIASLYRYDPNEDTQPGSFAATALQNIQQTFGSYGMELTNAQAGSYVQNLLTKGGADLTSIYSAGDAATAYATDMAKQSASSLFPTLAPLINSGQTLTGSGGMLTPYLSSYAQMLGVDPDTVTLTPQLIKLMAQGQTQTSSQVGVGAVGAGQALQSGKGESGATQATGGLKSLDQFQAAVMQDPTTGWQNSPSAHEAYANMTNTLLSTMGFNPPQGAQTPGTPQSTNLVGGEV